MKMPAGHHAHPGHRLLRLALVIALALPRVAHTGEPASLDRVQVSGQRISLRFFPGAASVVEGQTLRDGSRQVSLADALQAVPGVIALERHNHAQDVQLQSRGFGARSTFGIRGLTLITDGIPASALDGQGQASGFALSMLDRIEVLRGPLALQYGNAAGGAIIGESTLGDENTARMQAWAGSHGSHRISLRGDGSRGDWRARAGWMAFATDGHRPHGAARRDEGHAIVRWQPDAHHSLQLVVDALRQPQTLDPLGLTPAQWRAAPASTDPAALAFHTRKRIDQRQAGLAWQALYAPGREFTVAAWHSRREIEQFLAIPVAVQSAPGHSGGVVAPDRRSSGLSIRHRSEGAHTAWAIGTDWGWLDEDRRGWENFVGQQLGVRGRLRRDETNHVHTRDLWVSGESRFADHYAVLAAMRHGRLRFASEDHYRAPGNADDSGRLDVRETAFSTGIARQFAAGEVFASLGQGYETPTLNELAYRPDGDGGFNHALTPARFNSLEIGARWRGARHRASIAAYRITGRDEIVQVMSSGGRSSFANAARTRRHGLEAGLQGDPHPNFSYVLSANWIDARYTQGWDTQGIRNGTRERRRIETGTGIPGIPRLAGFLALDWHRQDRSLALALETAGNSAITVDDRASARAPGHLRHALALRWRNPDTTGWHVFARIDNLLNRRYIGSVIVNEANGRSFEPAPGRSFTVGLGWHGGE